MKVVPDSSFTSRPTNYLNGCKL